MQFVTESIHLDIWSIAAASKALLLGDRLVVPDSYFICIFMQCDEVG